MLARIMEPSHPVAGVVAVFAGGLVGSLARTTVGEAFPVGDGDFPLSTLAVNLIGSLVLGFYLARHRRRGSARQVQFWAVGVLGSFTTFSAFSLEMFRLIDTGSAMPAAGYAVLSIAGGLTLAGIGSRLGAASA